MGFKRRRPPKRLIRCRGCKAGATEPGTLAKCSECGIAVCQHLKDNLIVKSKFDLHDDECVWCNSMIIIEAD